MNKNAIRKFATEARRELISPCEPEGVEIRYFR